MRFFHLSDLHLGLKLRERDLLADQAAILEQITQYAAAEQPDAIVIAGDLYDKTIPSAEAVELFDHFVVGLTERVPETALLMISGNHDSAPRINLYRRLLERQQVHMIGLPPQTEEEFLEQVTLTDDFGPVHFYLLPFVKPSMVKRAVGTDENGNNLSYDATLHRLFEREQFDTSERNVLVSHQFYVPKDVSADTVPRMDSEIRTIGNIDEVCADVLEPFDYAALGHIHKPMIVGKSNIRYCGTPLACSVSEAGQQKGIVCVDLNQKGTEPQIRILPLHPMREVRILNGTLEEVLTQACEDYVTVILTDPADLNILDMQDRLHLAFPNLLEIRRDLPVRAAALSAVDLPKELDPFTLCCNFLGDPDDADQKLLKDILHTVQGDLMKPIQLKMQAFASYGVETCIDFRNLNQKLFLITGDTGSGKTTIFDAIVFALYGEASSSINKKEGIVLQSQYAPLNVEPYVELTFTEGNDEQCYTVRRVPKHLRLLTRGAGKGIDTREVNGSVTLTMPDGTDYPSKEAGKKIVDLIGLTKEQFMQIAMIAQGEFLQLLRAKSDDKKVIFRKLFHTELYEQIVREVDNRKKNLEKTLETVRTECQTELGHVRIPPQSERAGQLNAYLEQLQNGALVQMAPFLEELEALLQERKQEQKSAAARLKQAEKERDCIRDAETKAEGLQRAYEQLDAAELYLRQAELECTDYEEKERLVSKIRAAYAIDTEYRHLQKSSDLLAHTQKDLKMHQTNLPIQKKQAELCRVEEQAQQEHYNHVLEQTSKIEAQVTAALDIFAKQERAAAEMKTAAQNVATLQDSQQKTEESFTALTAFQEQYTNELAQYDTLFAEQERSHLEEKELAAFAEQLTALHRQADQLTLQKKRSADALTDYEAARRIYQAHKEHYEQLRQQFLDTQAGFLARDLAPSAPCPVCGSTEHPRLRILTESHPELTKEALDSAEAQATLLAEVQEKKSANSQAENAKFQQMERRLQEDWESFCEKLKTRKDPCTPATLTDADNWLKKQQRAWCAQRDFLQEQVRKQTACKNALDTTITKLRALEPIRTELQKKLQNANQQFTEKQTTYRTLDTSSAFSDRQAALAASKEAKAESEQAKALYEEKKAASAATSRTAEQTEALLRRCESELPGYEKAVQEQAAAYETLLAEHHVTEDDWQALTEQYPSAEADRLQRLCTEWRKQLTAATAKREAAATLIGKQERPDLALLKEQYLEAEQRVRTARDESDTIRMELQDNETVLRHLRPKLDAREQTVAEHARLERLYRQVSGNVKGSRMDLETYVQRYFLRRILYAANLRFQEMSGGQFELRMVEEAEAGDGKNRGLDLMVYSAVTGKVREIRTLSGGESFLAALSLALGMADQIKESAPGIHLDVMFLDEGFGSLDESARDQAVRVLQEMAGASRLIGIISHVTELKQEIDDQLLVTKDEHGSHVRWQIS